jgi:hypothetical protein
VQADGRLAIKEKVTTTDGALQVFREPDLESTVIAHVPKGVELQLGAATVFEGCEWIEATFEENVGYVLGLHAHAHTTFDYDPLPPKAVAGKLWACPTCNQLVTDPLRDPRKRLHCRAGHRVHSTRGPSADFSRYNFDGLVSFLLGGACYFPTYYVPLCFAGLFDRLLGKQIFPDFYVASLHIVAWGVVILRLLMIGAAVDVLRKGLVYARQSQPTKCLGLESIFQGLTFLTGFLLTGFFLLQTNLGAVSQRLDITLYRIALSFYDLQLWR